MSTKAVIYCFSGTGNTLNAVRAIARELDNCSVVRVTSAVFPASTDAEVIGFAFPVYGGGMPAMMVKFVRELQFSGAPFFFSLTTYGGMPGAANIQVRKILRDMGQELSSGFGMLMPANYTPMYGAIAEEKQKKLFRKAAEQIPAIVETIKTRTTNIIRKDNFLINFLFSTLIYPHAIKAFARADKKFRADDKCDGCGICAKVCPAANIQMSSGKPTWLGHCEQCMACLQWCPQEALQYGNITSKRKRYHHPETQVSDFIARS